MKISCMLNNRQTEFNTYSDRPLNLLLRDDAQITSLAFSCSGSECGNCVVLFDDKAALSCLIPAFKATGHHIVTFEGFMKTRFYTDIKRAYQKVGITPCEYCYRSKSLIIHSLLLQSASPREQEIRQAVSVNGCTCVDPAQMVAIVEAAANFRRSKRRVRRS